MTSSPHLKADSPSFASSSPQNKENHENAEKPLDSPVSTSQTNLNTSNMPKIQNDALLIPPEVAAKKTFVNMIENEFLGGAEGKVRGMPPDAPCECDQEECCGPESSCVNRTLLIECVDCGVENCRNKRFQKREYAKVEVFKTETKGFGLKTLEDLPENSLIREYVGEVITLPIFSKRTKQYAEEGIEHFYFMSLTPNEIIDATKKGNLSRFMNHSCNPNCFTERWIVRGKFRIGMFTNRFVPAGTELTFDYQFETYGKEAQQCFCGEENCRGKIGGEKRTEVYEYESEEEEEVLEETQQARPVKKSQLPLETEQDAQKAVRILTASTPKAIHKYLSRLQQTPGTNLAFWREFLRCRGLRSLKLLLESNLEGEIGLCRTVLRVMSNIPIAARNSPALVESRLLEFLPTIQKWEDGDGEVINLADQLFERLNVLPQTYRIPKIASTMNIPTPQVEKADEEDQKQLALARERRKREMWERERLERERLERQKRERERLEREKPKIPTSLQGILGEEVNGARKLLNNPDWLAYYDVKRGEFYFYNLMTKQTTWTQPAPQLAEQRIEDIIKNVAIRKEEKMEIVQEEEDLAELERLKDAPLELLPSKRPKLSNGKSKHREKNGDAERRDKDRKERPKEYNGIKPDKPKEKSDKPKVEKPVQTVKWTPEDEKAFRSVLAPYVVNCLAKWRDEMEKEKFKELARSITHTLIQKEASTSNPITQLTESVKTKTKKYVNGYMDRKHGVVSPTLSNGSGLPTPNLSTPLTPTFDTLHEEIK